MSIIVSFRILIGMLPIPIAVCIIYEHMLEMGGGGGLCAKH